MFAAVRWVGGMDRGWRKLRAEEKEESSLWMTRHRVSELQKQRIGTNVGLRKTLQGKSISSGLDEARDLTSKRPNAFYGL